LRIYASIAALSLAVLNAQFDAQVSQPPVAPPPRAWSEHLRNSTVSIGRAKTIDGKYTFDAIGTGVLVARKTAFSQYVAIVTAKHIVEDIASHGQSSVQVRFASEQEKPLSQDFDYKLPLADQQGRKLWISLPDGSDIALIRINTQFIYQLASEPVKLTDAIGIQDFEDATNTYEGENVVVFGFPSDVSVLMGSNSLVRAVLRSGVVAWVNPEGMDQPFMIDANILQGNSGGPVFKIPTTTDKFGNFVAGGPPLFLGIVTETVGNEYVKSIGGLGRVEPASKIRDLFNIAFPKF
jgi:hypothetical protein